MYLGIDLGTSNSAIVGNDGGQLRLFKTSDGYDVLPSAIMIHRGAMFVGKRAYDQEAFSPENVAKRFKRMMGTNTLIKFSSAGREMSPEEASTEILKTLIAQARMTAGEFQIEGTIITIPAAFNQMQVEATMRAARDAGIDKIGLLQEPIAAAMATIADRRKKNAALNDGQFLVYDLGGGTFDAAIVQSVGGTVNVIAHTGINMLGGADFDRTIVNTIVRTWLSENFDLPQDLQKDPAYQRVLRIAAFSAEKAKIELSTQPTSTIFTDESQIGTRDRAGREIYLDIPLTRSQVEALILDQLDRSIEECRSLLNSNGYSPSDIDRLIFIGGPTYMPIVRSQVTQQLGISADLDTDPMTAVAAGAAIFAESRDWSSGPSKAKPSRASTRTEGPINIEYRYPERTADEKIRIMIKPAADLAEKEYRLQIDSDMGWTSGQLPLDGTDSISDVPVARRGDNQFRITVFAADGIPIAQAETRFIIKRIDAAAGSAPATHTIAVKVVEDGTSSGGNTLDVLIEKGHPLPAKGNKDYRAAKELTASDKGHLDFEVYQMESGATDPNVNLHVGAFRIVSTDLEPGDVIRKGDRIRVFWTLDENGLLDCALQIDSIGRRFAIGKMFTDQGAKKNFEGKEGEELASSVLDLTQAELNQLRDALGDRAGDEAAELQSRIERQREDLNKSYEAEDRRSITEEARSIRQEISKIKDKPEHIGDLLRAEIESIRSYFDTAIRPSSNPSVGEKFDRLAQQAKESALLGNIEDAKHSISEMRYVAHDELKKQPDFLINNFRGLARERHLAVDKTLHDRLVETGNACIERKDLNALQSATNQIVDNRFPTKPSESSTAALAGLMRS